MQQCNCVVPPCIQCKRWVVPAPYEHHAVPWNVHNNNNIDNNVQRKLEKINVQQTRCRLQSITVEEIRLQSLGKLRNRQIECSHLCR